MSESSGRRAAAAAVVLVVVWVTTYWLWDPGDGTPALAFDAAPAAVPVELPESRRPEAGAGGRGALGETALIEEPDEGDAALGGRDGARLVAPEFTEYTVRRGDQIMTIAERVYGNTAHWQAISKANPTVDPMKLRVGQTLRLPRDPRNVQGKVVDAGGAVREPTVVEPEMVTHVVQRNDSLWKIAASFYGDGSRWTLIRDANRAAVGEDGERLKPGMELVIPAAPRGAR